MKKWIVVLVFMIFPALPGLSKAQEEEKSAATLDEVVVTAGRMEEKKKTVTSDIVIIDEEEIKNSSAQDLGDLLSEKGIGHIQKYPGALTSIGIRGFRTETHGNDLDGYVLILLDGRRAGTGNAAKIMTKNIERIEIIRGPASVQYGSAAMGGVVNVITKQGKGKPGVFVEGVLGSFGHEEAGLGFYGGFEGFDFSGSITTQSMDDYDTGDGDKFSNTGYDKQENYSFNLGYEFLPDNRISLIYTLFDLDKAGSPNYLSVNDLDDFVDKEYDAIDFIYTGGLPDGVFSWMARYFDTEDMDKWTNPTGSNPDFWDDGIPSKRETDQKGAQAQATMKTDVFSVTAGFDWVKYKIKNTWDPRKTEYDNPAGFILAKTELLDQRLIITGGLRYDEYDLKVKGGAGRDENDDNLAPRFGMAYLLTDNLTLRANYGEAFKMPSANEIAADYFSWGTHYVGNPDLDPEKSRTYEGGVDCSYGAISSSLTYFYTDFEDKIESVIGAGGVSTWDNIGDATIEGIEFEVSCNLEEFFELDFEIKPYASLVYLFDYEDDETGNDLLYTSDINLSYGVTLSDLKGLSANLNFAYTGKQDIQDWEGGLWPTPVIEKAGFTVANFTVSKTIYGCEEYGYVTMRGEIQNLLDKDYAYVKGYPMQGRSFFIGMRYDY